MERRSYEAATRAAQGVLSAANRSLVVDGKWGSFTDSAYLRAQPETRASVDSVLRVFGETRDTLRRFRLEEKKMADAITVPATSTAGRWVSAPDMRIVIRKAAAAAGVDAETMWLFLQLEAPVKQIGGVPHFDRMAVNALGYSGLFQFDRKGEAWAVAARNVTGLASFEAGKFDPYQSSLAAAGYLKANTRTIRTFGYGGPISPNLAYLMHNQGARGAYLIITGQRRLAGKQSREAIAVAEAARREYLA